MAWNGMKYPPSTIHIIGMTTPSVYLLCLYLHGINITIILLYLFIIYLNCCAGIQVLLHKVSAAVVSAAIFLFTHSLDARRSRKLSTSAHVSIYYFHYNYQRSTELTGVVTCPVCTYIYKALSLSFRV